MVNVFVFLKDFFKLIIVCVVGCIWEQMPTESLGSGIIGSLKLPNQGTRTQTGIISKDRKCS